MKGAGCFFKSISRIWKGGGGQLGHRLLKHVPNGLTLLRALLCPVVVLFFFRAQYGVGLVIFLVACLTDYLDGFVAKRFQATSLLGSFLDPLCDKLFLLSFYALLMVFGYCPPWFLGLWLAVSLLQSIGLILVNLSYQESARPVAPLRSGKWHTALQFFWVGLLLLDIFLRKQAGGAAVGAFVYGLGYTLLAALQIMVFFRYFHHYRITLSRYFSLHPLFHRPS